MTLASGSRLGSYEILSQLGEGGMGEVWKGRDMRLDRFDREARAVAALNHPNIHTLHDVGPNYLVMELVEGVALKGPTPAGKTVEYAGQILDAWTPRTSKGSRIAI